MAMDKFLAVQALRRCVLTFGWEGIEDVISSSFQIVCDTFRIGFLSAQP